VLRPGAPLLFIEHVAASSGKAPMLRAAQAVLEPLQRALADGCHLTRQTGEAVSGAGFAAVNLMHFDIDAGLISPHVAGIAFA
jgi:hypothetical protein